MAVFDVPPMTNFGTLLTTQISEEGAYDKGFVTTGGHYQIV